MLVGAGMGLVLAPLAGIILQSLDPDRAGAASGMLTTMQNVGNTLGVAITGVIFFGALHAGYARAFELSVTQLAVLLVAVAALTRLLPGRLLGRDVAQQSQRRSSVSRIEGLDGELRQRDVRRGPEGGERAEEGELVTV